MGSDLGREVLCTEDGLWKLGARELKSEGPQGLVSDPGGDVGRGEALVAGVGLKSNLSKVTRAPVLVKSAFDTKVHLFLQQNSF